MAKRPKSLVIGSIIGAVVLVLALVLILTSTLFGGSDETPTTSPSPSGGGASEPSPSASGPVAPGTGEPTEDPGAAPVEGWVAEPSTSDPQEYAEAALRAVTTFDPSKTSRDDLLAHLESWMTPATEVDGQINQQVTGENKRLLSRDVVLDAEQWEYVASIKGTVEGEYGELELVSSIEEFVEYGYVVDVQQMVRPGDGQTDAWAESRTLSVLVECSDRVELSDTQTSGDCKVVRWNELTPEDG